MTHLIDVQNNAQETIYHITLNQPQTGNCFNSEMADELKSAMDKVEQSETCQVLTIQARGDDFCVGDDISQIQSVSQASMKENYTHIQTLAQVLKQINQLGCIVLAGIQGQANDTALALLASCDYVIASTNSSFSCQSVKYGLLPSPIAPYLVRLLGPALTRHYLVTGRVFDTQEAISKGLAHESVSQADLQEYISTRAEQLLASGPMPVKAIKYWLGYYFTPIEDHLYDQAVKLSADVRLSEEAQEGLHAFVENRKPHFREE